MFGRIARRYDLMNTLMTGGMDRTWRRVVAPEALGPQSSVRGPGASPVLDVGTGTGKLAQAILEAAPTARVVGVDFTFGMLRVAPRGLSLAAGDALSLQLLDAATGAQLKMLVDAKGSSARPETTATRSLAFSPDGATLASAGPGNAVTLWPAATGQKGAALVGQAIQINSVAFSPDGKYVAGGGADDITVWELPAGTSPQTLVHQSTEHGSVNSVAFSADGRYLAGASIMGLDLWDTATWKAIPITTALNQGVLDAFAFSPDSQVLAGVATGQDHIVRAWPLKPAPQGDGADRA